MKVKSTALSLNCERRTSLPVESCRAKSGEGAGGCSSAGASSVAPLASAAESEEDFDDPPHPTRSAVQIPTAAISSKPRGAFLFVTGSILPGRVFGRDRDADLDRDHAGEQRRSTGPTRAGWAAGRWWPSCSIRLARPDLSRPRHPFAAGLALACDTRGDGHLHLPGPMAAV